MPFFNAKVFNPNKQEKSWTGDALDEFDELLVEIRQALDSSLDEFFIDKIITKEKVDEWAAIVKPKVINAIREIKNVPNL